MSRAERSWMVRAPHAPALTGALLGLASVIESIARYTGTGAIGPFILLVSLVGLAGTGPVALSQPTVAAGAVLAASVLSLAAFHTLTVAGIAAQLLTAYRLGHRGWPPAAVLLGLPYLPLALVHTADAYPRVAAVLLASLVPVTATGGIARRIRREDAENRAARQAIEGTLLAHTARAERARIARELHDVVAHHISMIAVQAETARLTTPGMPAAGAHRLSAIGDTARAALTEMRRLLGVLREDAQSADARTGSAQSSDAQTKGAQTGNAQSKDTRAEGAARQPQPGLRQLNDLLDEARDASGTGTRLILRGPPVSLDPGVELAAYRIVQEALTNARRHAPGAAVDVELHYTAAALRLLIRDNGPGPAGPGPGVAGPGNAGSGSAGPGGAGSDGAGQGGGGHGLLGMRERAAAVGGELRTGAGAAGGFLVEASLPTQPEDIR